MLEPGVELAGKFKLLKTVGQGGMGAVWRARNLTTGAQVAIKVLRRDFHEDPLAEQRFRYEAKLGAVLAHRNITRVFDLVEDTDGALILVMELLHGQTLRQYAAEQGPLSTREAVAILVAVLAGLQHAHEHGVIHRDLKPSNILLHVDPDGLMTPKLLDFGIAKSEESKIETRTGDAFGTPSYMSPEQVRTQPLDARSDIFGCAVLLYEIISGTNPFSQPSPTATLAKVLELDVDPDPSIDPRVWLEIQRALSKQPYQRHGSAKEFAAALAAALGETEGSLVSSLRREVTNLPQLDAFTEITDVDEVIHRSVPVPAMDRSGGTRGTLPVRSLKPLAYGAGAVAIVAIAGGIGLAASRTHASTPPPSAPPAISFAARPPPPPPPPGPGPGPSESPVIELPASPQTASPTPASNGGRRPSGGHTSPQPSRSLARTPGF